MVQRIRFRKSGKNARSDYYIGLVLLLIAAIAGMIIFTYVSDITGFVAVSDVDTDSPIVVLEIPSDASWAAQAENELVYTVEDATSGIANCSLYWNGELNQTNTEIVEGIDQSFLISVSDGEYSWYIDCFDNSTEGNEGNSETWTLNVDTSIPLISYTEPTPSDDSHQTEDWFNVTVNAEGDNLNYTLFELYSEDGLLDSTALPTTESGTYSVSWVDLDDGNYWFNVTDYDLSGNANSTETRTISIDTSEPQIIFNPGTSSGVLGQDWIFVNVTASGDMQDVIFEWNGTNETFDGNDGEVFWENKTSLAYGNYTIRAFVTDTMNRTNSTASVTISLRSRPNWSDIPSPLAWPEDTTNSTLNLSQYSSDAEGGDLNWTAAVANVSAAIDNNTGIVTLTPAANWSGTTTVTFTAWNELGLSSTSNSVVLNVTPVNDRPYLFAVLPDVILPEDGSNATISMTHYFRDIDNATLLWNYARSNTNVSVAFTSLKRANITSAANWFGTASVTLMASDGQYSINDSIMVTVTSVNDAPEVNLPANISVNEDSTGQLNLSLYVSDVDNSVNEISWSVETVPNITIAINNGNKIATFTPIQDWYGSKTVTFTAHDPGGATGDDTIKVVVNPANDAPRLIAMIPNQARDTSGSWTMNLNNYFRDVDGDSMKWSYELNSASGSITVGIDNSTGVATLSSNTNSVGTVRFLAFDPSGANTASNVAQITVAIPGVAGAPSGSCQENWACVNWSECQPNGMRVRTCTDSNTCNTTSARPPLVEPCNYNAGPDSLPVPRTNMAPPVPLTPGPSIPSCSDGVQNNDETGVDCGGSCQACRTQPDTEIAALASQSAGNSTLPALVIITAAVVIGVSAFTFLKKFHVRKHK